MAIFAATMMAIGMIGGAQTARTQAKASMKMAEEQTKQSKAKQEELNSQSELARSIQKINNDRVMRAADKTYAAAATNLSRNRAAVQTSNIMTQIAQAEAAGAYSANVASKGIGGGSVEVIENTMALRDSLKGQLTKNAQSQADYDAVQTLAGIIPAGWQQQDMTVLSGNQSAAASVPSVQGGFNWAAALGQSKDLMGMLANLTSSPSSSLTGSGIKLSDTSLSNGYLGLSPTSSSGLGIKSTGSGFYKSTFEL